MASNTSNLFAIEPELPEPFPTVPGYWTCPKTGLKVPKDPIKNLAWRARLLDAAADDPELQQDLFTASAKSLLFWVNAFAMTFRIFEEGDSAGEMIQAEIADLPFVTWPIQDTHMLLIEKSINSAKSLLTDKTRDMGATWCHVAVFHHQWLFSKQPRMLLEMSRVEKDVDDAENPKCLFVKHDYINKWLPTWMIHPNHIKRTKLHMVNLVNGNRIDGESSNKAAGAGDRRHAVLLDEFAKMDNSFKIKSGLRDVSRCLLPNSTPFGAGTAYSKWRLSGTIPVFDLPWWEHPEKGKGRYTRQDETTGRWEIRSPWYDHEEEVRDPKEMAQEINRDHVGSGNTYFAPHVVEEHKRLFASKPHCTRAIDFKKNVSVDAMPAIISRSQRDKLQIVSRGDWSIWGKLSDGRLDQTKNYVIGCDISKGMGASNSVASVLCTETREKVAEFTSKTVPPHEFARLVCAAALWIGGARKNGRPLIIWEANGDPGVNFGRELVKVLAYPFLWFDRPVGTVRDRRSKRYGWSSSRNKKEDALGLYRRALSTGGIVNHSEEALDEALLYVHYPNGGIGPAEWLDENVNMRQSHGDRVIADMLCLVGLDDSPRTKRETKKYSHRSLGGRMNHWKRAKKEAAKPATSFDFRGS